MSPRLASENGGDSLRHTATSRPAPFPRTAPRGRSKARAAHGRAALARISAVARSAPGQPITVCKGTRYGTVRGARRDPLGVPDRSRPDSLSHRTTTRRRNATNRQPVVSRRGPGSWQGACRGPLCPVPLPPAETSRYDAVAAARTTPAPGNRRPARRRSSQPHPASSARRCMPRTRNWVRG